MSQVRFGQQLCSEHLVQFFDWYETPNHLWVIQELCMGGSLAVLLQQDGALPEKAIAEFASDIADGLSFLHSSGIMHASLHPSKVGS